MTQIAMIIKSLDAISNVDPMASAIVVAGGLPGGLHHGTDVQRKDADGAPILKPFGLLNATEIGSMGTSAGVRLVNYRVDLTVVVDESNIVTGALLEIFHRYWDRLFGTAALAPPNGSLDPDLATFVQIWPEESESGESEEQKLGKDILLGVTSWTLQIAEHQPSLE